MIMVSCNRCAPRKVVDLNSGEWESHEEHFGEYTSFHFEKRWVPKP